MGMPRFQPQWPDIDKDTAILWEPCSRSHGEIVPGYARYLLDLGYRVVVLMTPQRIAEGLFSRFEHPRLELTQLSQRQISRFVRTPAIREAALFLVSTAGKLPHKPDGTADLQSVFGTESPRKLLMVEHDAGAQIDAGVWADDTITLRGLTYRGRTSVVVNPHDFGNVRITPKTSGKTVFLLVGAARARRRNQNMVYAAAERLLDAGLTAFEIRLIGKTGADRIPARLRDCVKTLGRLDFAAMYREIEDSDVIVTAFQKDNPDHDAYKRVKTTGSFQLCYGFRKTCIVQEEFAAGTALTAENSLFYREDDDLFDAMRTAIRMSAEDYARCQAALARAADSLYERSRQNLKTLING